MIEDSINVYWTYEGVQHTGVANIDAERIGIYSDERNATIELLFAEDLDEGVTLEDVWYEFLSQADDGEGGYDITNVELT